MTTDDARRLFAGPCDFIAGITEPDGFLDSDLPEVAFAGRSNVGKSSLINAVAGRKTLARVSQTPGRTQQINFFDVGGLLALVDMPGHGFAKISKMDRQKWEILIRSYCRQRPNLRAVFLLIDARHGVKDVDREVMHMLDDCAVSCRIVLTKADKASAAEMEKTRAGTALLLKEHPAAYPETLVTSAVEGAGIDELRLMIYQLCRA